MGKIDKYPLPQNNQIWLSAIPLIYYLIEDHGSFGQRNILYLQAEVHYLASHPEAGFLI
jgi:hypothetical protein